MKGLSSSFIFSLNLERLWSELSFNSPNEFDLEFLSDTSVLFLDGGKILIQISSAVLCSLSIEFSFFLFSDFQLNTTVRLECFFKDGSTFFVLYLFIFASAKFPDALNEFNGDKFFLFVPCLIILNSIFLLLYLLIISCF